MIVLHGIWVYGALWLWAEDSGRPAGSAPRPGRQSRAPRQHPFACDVSLLTDALAELADPVADLARKAVEDELTLFLPSLAAGPVASPDLIRPVTSDAGHGQRAGARRPAPGARRGGPPRPPPRPPPPAHPPPGAGNPPPGGASTARTSI